MSAAPSGRHAAGANQRLAIYVAAFVVIAVYHFATGLAGAGTVTWLLVGLGLALVLAGALSGGHIAGATEAGTLLTLALALLPLLDHLATTDQRLADGVAARLVWPEPLLALVGARLLATAADRDLAAFLVDPLRTRAAVGAQPVGAALALAVFLTLVFLLAVHALPTLGQGPVARMIHSSLEGATLIHGAIDVLFFVIVALIADAAARLAADRALVARLVAGDEPLTRDLVAARAAGHAHRRGARLVEDAIDAVSGASLAGSARSQARDLLDEASRRFLRTLLPLLPLLGFLGTVIGLATAIADLPSGLGASGGAAPDVSASLAGLAIKFETTLLGLLASLIAGVALNALERREAELAATTLLRVAARLEPAP